MKGLVCKDIITAWKCCRTLIVMSLLLTVISFFTTDIFVSAYPLILVSVLPVNLITVDENEGWSEYVLSLPITRKDYVSGKYVTGLLIIALFIIPSLIVVAFRSVSVNDFLTMALFLIIPPLLFSSLIYPFNFRFGGTKGSMYSLVITGVIVTIVTIQKNLFLEALSFLLSAQLSLLLPFTVIALYALSWFLSVRFYERREI